MEVNSLLFFLVKLEHCDEPTVLTVVKMDVACGGDVMLFGRTADGAEDILINELRILEERLDKDPVLAVFIIDMLL